MRRRISKFVVWLLLAIPMGLLENAMFGWTGAQIAAYLGWSNPTVAEVLGITWNYGVPLVIAGLILIGYHLVIHSRWFRPAIEKEEDSRKSTARNSVQSADSPQRIGIQSIGGKLSVEDSEVENQHIGIQTDGTDTDIKRTKLK